MISGLVLPLTFDVGRLKADLAAIDPADWAPHYNEKDFGGDWRGVALRSATGGSSDLAAHGSTFVDTPALDKCAYFREVLSAFDCPLKSVRLLSLSEDSFIREHSDPGLGYEDGEVRIHIPIQTGPGVEFYLQGERLLLNEGNTYYVNVGLPHRVNNRGPRDRIHLVIDAEVNAWVHQLFRNSGSIPLSQNPPGGFTEFSQLIFDDPALTESLARIPSKAELVETVVRLGAARGFVFNAADVEARSGPASNLDGWMPVKLNPTAMEWIYRGDTPLAEPFFEDTVRICLRRPFARVFRREIPLNKSPLRSDPIGFVLHISRCGSTLISQMLGLLPGVEVISEAPPMGQAIHSNEVDWVRFVARSFGSSGRSIFKLDAWDIHALPLIRKAFPDTPWVFVTRDENEVVASQTRAPGIHCLPGAMADPSVLGMTYEDITGLTRQQWTEQVIGNIAQSARRFQHEPLGLFVDYSELPSAVWEKIVPHFGLSATDADIDRMRERAKFHGKTKLPWPGFDVVFAVEPGLAER